MNKRAFSMIEMVVVLALIAILLGIGYRLSTTVLRQSNVTTTLVTLKSSIQKARGFAIEKSVPVQFTFRNTQIYAVADLDRNGTFGDRFEELVIGEDIGAAVEMDYAGVNQVTVASGDVTAVSHWSGHANSLADFPAGTFIISPTGLIRSAGGAPLQGAYYLKTEDEFSGAIYVSSLGDIKTAIKEATGSWEWTD